MTKRFPRKKMLGSISLLMGIMIMSRGLRLDGNGFVPEAFYYIAASLFFIYTLWIYFMPYVSVNEIYIVIHQLPFKTRNIQISELKKIEISDEQIRLNDNSVNATIKLREMTEVDKNDLIIILKELNKEINVQP